ncbi:estradiol 17-beta-dehydrogenase 11-like [Hetaerina americana]|uniref:estradiol 17-beta-dehydrogenase 11-like n=1 Tax=Hetaerina americana TaxID=62018 RepID=UPI003A7F4560
MIRGIYKIFVRRPRRSMEDEIVLVTGAAQGLGRGMTLEFARLGARVVCWDINEQGCRETAALAAARAATKGGKSTAHAYKCDITNRDEVAATARKVQDEVGQVTILVNNAGIVSAGQLDKYNAEQISRLVSTNFTSHFWTIEAFLPHMKEVNKGQIVCISSMSSLTPTEYLVPYSATKCAVTGLMDALDEELASLGFDKIKITTVFPFFTATHGLMGSIKDKNDKKYKTGPDIMQISDVVKDIVRGVVTKRREFTVPGYLLAGTKLVKLYPRYVSRACKQVLLGKWKFFFADRKNPIQIH